MKYLLTTGLIIFILLSGIAYADEIILYNGIIIKAKVKSVDKSYVRFVRDNDSTLSEKSISRNEVEKIIYGDGEEVIVPRHNTADNNNFENDTASSDSGITGDDIENENYQTAEEDITDDSLIRFTFFSNKGFTSVDIYDKKKKKIASGDGSLTQFMISASINSSDTGFYVTPDLGYFYRQLSVNDYSYNVESSNADVDGYIPGIISDPSTGEEISKNSVSSLAYKATFNSFFLDMKAGGAIIVGPPKAKFTINPYVYAGLVDLRKSEFVFDTFSGSKKFRSSYDFAFIGSYGTGIEFGMYYPGVHFGWQLGYDMRCLRKFKIPDGVVFKEVYDDTELGIKRTRENTARYTEITAHLVTLSAYYCF